MNITKIVSPNRILPITHQSGPTLDIKCESNKTLYTKDTQTVPPSQKEPSRLAKWATTLLEWLGRLPLIGRLFLWIQKKLGMDPSSSPEMQSASASNKNLKTQLLKLIPNQNDIDRTLVEAKVDIVISASSSYDAAKQDLIAFCKKTRTELESTPLSAFLKTHSPLDETGKEFPLAWVVAMASSMAQQTTEVNEQQIRAALLVRLEEEGMTQAFDSSSNSHFIHWINDLLTEQTDDKWKSTLLTTTPEAFFQNLIKTAKEPSIDKISKELDSLAPAEELRWKIWHLMGGQPGIAYAIIAKHRPPISQPLKERVQGSCQKGLELLNTFIQAYKTRDEAWKELQNLTGMSRKQYQKAKKSDLSSAT